MTTRVNLGSVIGPQGARGPTGKGVDELRIGGRNLIKNSNFSKAGNFWQADAGTLNIVTDAEYGHIATFKSTGGNRRFYVNVSNVWKKDTVYTVSFYAKASVSGVKIAPSRNLNDTGENITLTDTWQRYTTAIKCTSTVSNGTLSFQVNNNDATYYIANVKLETGNKETDWMPAVEDAIIKVSMEFYPSTSKETLAGGAWSWQYPESKDGKYIWYRIVATDGAGLKTYSSGFYIAVEKGTDGTKIYTQTSAPTGVATGTVWINI